MPPRLSLWPLSYAWSPATTVPRCAFSTTPKAASSAQDLLDLEPNSFRRGPSRGARNEPPRKRIPYPRDTFRDLPSSSSSSASSPSTSGNSYVQNIINNSYFRQSVEKRKTDALEKQREFKMQDDLNRQALRKWFDGDVYAPHDLSVSEAKKLRHVAPQSFDMLDAVDINPVDQYKNFAMISEYMTTMGRIKHSKQTNLRPVHQRKMAKAIRRSIGLGLHPSVHIHPMLMLENGQRISRQIAPRTQQKTKTMNVR